jgi:hypothetical protein
MQTGAPEATRVQRTTEGSQPGAGPAVRERTTQEWDEIVRALTATDEDDVPVFGRLPA